MFISKIQNRLTHLKNKHTIRKYDSSVDHLSWRGVDFYQNYFTPFSLPDPVAQYTHGVYRETIINSHIGAFAAALIGDFKERIVGFLGDRVRLDDIYMFWYDPAKRGDGWSYSNSWHDDNVGHRIKIFACFEGNGTTPTVVVPNSYNKPYSRRREERQRFAGIRDIGSRPDEIRLAYKAGDVAMFDTSCLHRGLYEEPASRRVVLVMEFIDRSKCNEIAGIVPCAPGMSPTGKVLFEPSAYEALRQTGLLDEALVARDGEHYCYSLANYTERRDRQAA